MYTFKREDGGVGLADVQWCECSAAGVEGRVAIEKEGEVVATKAFCNTRFVSFFADNVSSVFVRSVFQSSACLSDVLAVLVCVSYRLHCNAQRTLVELQSSLCFMS